MFNRFHLFICKWNCATQPIEHQLTLALNWAKIKSLLGKIKRARAIYEIFGVDKIYRITLPVSFFSELRREEMDNIILSCR
ncbi:hypothetical protein RclHR1_05170006 [Rhizophagus clarus]|uniref:Uncharacterized protein n=1 Tax=Rhizophagus clarus TaxID=94130 RepID=A0A2Z6RL52_9GLOM|nr:hypothetical protein RclHR1_05170006 [Rhizophagus clarus]GES91505.1 hypothetical protein RCL_e20483_RclHR1_05170006 [Rhizophagus clarus]